MGANYTKTSMYYETPIYGNNFLDLYEPRYIPRLQDDIVFLITEVYKYKPDLLAADLYQDSRLWWVFTVRNPNLLKDPIFDFLPGRQIFIPKKEELINALGL